MMGEGGGCVEGGWGGDAVHYWLLDTTATATLPQTQKVESRKDQK